MFVQNTLESFYLLIMSFSRFCLLKININLAIFLYEFKGLFLDDLLRDIDLWFLGAESV
jgi:hypothetical protein